MILGRGNITITRVDDGVQGDPGYTVTLTKDSQAISCNLSGIPLNLASSTCVITVFKGNVALLAVDGTAMTGKFSFAITKQTGCTTTRTASSFTLSAMTAETARVELSISVEGKQVFPRVVDYTKLIESVQLTGKLTELSAKADVMEDRITQEVSGVINWTKEEIGTSIAGTIKSVTDEYYLSTSSTSLTGGSWVTTPPVWVNGKFFWTRTIITYTNNTTSTTPPVCVTGATGSTGGTGNGISAVDVLYYLSTSATSLSGGSWVTTPPAWVNGKYIWSKTKITYTNGTTKESAAACITGGTGATGAAGKGIGSTTVTYQASTSGTTVPTGTWSTTIPAVAANQYLWTRTIITYTDNTTSTSYAIGKMGATGATGKGVKSVVPEYYLSTSSTTQSGGSWSTAIPAWTNGKYIWTRLVTTYTDNSTTTTSPVYDIANKAVDVAYSKVQAGIDNLATGITIFAKNNDFNALGTRVSNAETQLKILPNKAELVVTKDNIVSQINLAPGTATILADKIDLKGNVTFSMLDASAQSTINGKITSDQAGTIADGKVNALRNTLGSFATKKDLITLAELGTTIIQGGKIIADLIDVATIFAKDIVFSGSLTSSDYKVTTSGAGASVVVTTVGSRYSKSGFVVSSGGGTGILPGSTGVTQVAKIEAIGTQALIVGLEIVVKNTDSYGSLHVQNALVVEARTVCSTPENRPRSIYSRAGDIVVENGDIITNGFIYAGQGIRAVPRVITITPGYNTRRILSRREIDNTDVIYYYNINNSTQIKLPDADEGKRITIVNTGTKAGGISDTLAKGASYTLNTWVVIDLVFILGFHNALGRGWMLVSDYSN